MKGKQVRLPALKIPSDPPKFRPKASSKDVQEKAPTSLTSHAQSKGDQTLHMPEVNPRTLLPKLGHSSEADPTLPALCGLPECAGVLPDGYGGGVHLCGMINTRTLTATPGGSIVPKQIKGKHLAYGTNNWMQLLVSGQLPPHVLASFLRSFVSKQQKPQAKDINMKYRAPLRNRNSKIWEPKKTPPPIGSGIEKSLLEAQYRHKNRMEDISAKCKMQAKKAEKNLFRKAESQDVRVNAYLDKLEKRTRTKQQKNKNNSTCETVASAENVNALNSNLQPIWEKIRKRLLSKSLDNL